MATPVWISCALLGAVALAAEEAPVESARIYFAFGGKQTGRWTAGALVGWDQPAPAFYAFDKQGAV